MEILQGVAPPRFQALAAFLGDAAAEALLAEAALQGKPGLVGPSRPGAHDDMDHPLMVASAESLRPWFAAFASRALSAAAGGAANGAGAVAGPREILAALRPLGLRAEEDMFRTTHGVNTHKGAVFTLGLLVAAAALAVADYGDGDGDGEPGGALAETVLRLAAAMASGIVGAELAGHARAAGCTVGTAGIGADGAGTVSAGTRLYRELGVRGVRGEAEDGYPILARRILPPLRRSRSAPVGEREMALMDALLGSMAELDDTCVLSRGGPEGLAIVRAGAARVLEAGALHTDEGRAALARLDAEFVERRLSPGGSANLLAAGIFLDAVEVALGP